MKKYQVVVLILLVIEPLFSQEINFKNFKIETGVHMPMGNLADKIGLSEELELYYRMQSSFDDIVDLGFKINILNHTKAFTYFDRDTIYQTNSKDVNLSFLTKINKHYDVEFLNKHFKMEWTNGFGFNFLLFDDKERLKNEIYSYTDDDGNLVIDINNDIKSLISPYFSQGIGMSKGNFGFSVNYIFTPYNWLSKRIEKNFGNSSISYLITYKL